ncbi:putative ethylene-responsive transcription factor RAP2-4-like isoform 2 [Capsicum annuum]|nr:putative ethylene-responsive transcription factor RAP2-4-like isoform 2 [Capsicum annuum]KAF3678370.1 putative ethylene-responsive transcription factor RAP2-4-like isoform 2 [Capsicum annuum]
MEITIDIYNNSSSNNNTSVFSVPLREELMKALEPFMKGASCFFPSSAASSSSPLTSFSSSFYPYAGEAVLAYDKAAYKLREEFSRINFPHLRHQLNNELSNVKLLHFSVDVKLQSICQSLDNSNSSDLCSKSNTKPRKSEPKLASLNCTSMSKITVDDSLNKELSYQENANIKIEASSSISTAPSNE